MSGVISTGSPRPTASVSRLTRIRYALTPREWGRIGGMASFVIFLHVLGWVVLAGVIAPQHLSVGSKAFGLGVGLTAYTLGMRHAFDADHIAAIDNTTRKLMGSGQRPLSVGFWFSLGHSSIVFGLAVLLSLGVRHLVGPVQDSNSSLHHYTGLIGTSISGTFLYIIAAINLMVLVGILRVFRSMRSGRFDEAELEAQLNNRGFMNRLFGGRLDSITKPWQMYPVGMLFGLGFDTATEVALLVLAGAGAATGLPWYAILVLPVLFAAGMSLLDTIDGTFMNFAYDWAFSKPVRKVFYNLTITGLSIVVAFVIGTVELLCVLAEQLNLSGPFWDWISGLDLNTVGFVIVGAFVVTWLGAVAVWRFGNIEQKWSADVRDAELAPAE
ncbi:high-affinity nickel-transport protein [Frankineae bacterium MT45]|nr:high-affinity nickel-transport protein [Frankineae bacterium MT45]